MSNSDRPALGQKVALGALYDAKLDIFHPGSILTGVPPTGAVTERSAEKTNTSVTIGGTYRERHNALDIQGDTAASILAGLIKPQGSGVYLRNASSDRLILCGAIHHHVSTVQEKLNFMAPELHNHLDLDLLQNRDSTHVVLGINWGLHTVLEVKQHLSQDANYKDSKDAFEADLTKLRTFFGAGSQGTPSTASSRMNPEYEYTLYSDAFEEEGLVLQTADEALQFIRLIPDHISQSSDGKGWPLSYALLPLTMLHHFIQLPHELQVTSSPISPEYLAKFTNLFDNYEIAEAKLRAYYADLSRHSLHTSESHIEEVRRSIDQLRKAKKLAQEEFKEGLVSVRRGQTASTTLWDLFNQYNNGDLSPRKLSAIAGQESSKLDFINHVVSNGAIYIGHNGLSYEDAIDSHGDSGCYAFLFHRNAMKSQDIWNDNCALLMGLLTRARQTAPVYVVDCDATSGSLDSDAPRICRFQNGEESISDLLDHQKFMAEKSLAQYQTNALDTSLNNKPVKRRFVKIPCPCGKCDPTRICEWSCSFCLAPIEYGFTDEFIYCECGRAPYRSYQFKCNGDRHGTDYVPYSTKTLGGLLGNLDQSDYINILILGETGVGKSTFINAFINYLSYETLDLAKASDQLESVIPCSFSIQVMNRNDPNQPIEEKVIKVGGRDDEADGSKGASATQQTNVYSVNIGSATYRLIDTPGIGDTRGIQYDKKNMADILSTLSSYENLHGILILLKSNNARLTITFRFCVKELLAHLHRSAVENIVFGFTNTRISNYTPGDTFQPLMSLLKEHSDMGLTLSNSTTYCFDSESFRYLAAYKNECLLPNEEDFRRSWEHSRMESVRLVDYFKTRKPHSVVSTISLNGARQLIMELTKPMAEISKLIRDNITAMEDKKQQLLDTRLTGDNLRKRLQLDKIQFQSRQLDKPRTVCKNTTCCDFKDSGKGDGETVTIYKSHCHPVCYLTDVKQDVVAHPNLIRCAAFSGSDHCKRCTHHWQEHMHVLYELEQVTVQVTDTEIQRQLQANAGDVTLRQTGIAEASKLIGEYKSEHMQIQEAAARFGLFLKAWALTPINDATEDYINMLIQDEESKIEAGRQLRHNVDINKKRLQGLKEDKQAHLELVNTLTKHMRAPRNAKEQLLDEKGVEQLVARLYGLPHFGQNLKAVKNTITSAHKATYRERPYRIGGRAGAGFGARRSKPQQAPARVITVRKRSPPKVVPKDGHRKHDNRSSGLFSSMFSGLSLR
jgi:GTP-binding protein EngB required for normal cell division